MSTIEITRGERGFIVTGACVDIEFLILGMIQNNTYFISDGKGLMVVDPSADVNRILALIGDRKLDADHLHASSQRPCGRAQRAEGGNGGLRLCFRHRYSGHREPASSRFRSARCFMQGR